MKVKIEKIVYKGYGLSRSKRGVIFVPFVVPGEELKITSMEDKGSYLFARNFEVLAPSEKRIQPKCKLYGICGGCHFQHVSYQLQKSWKKEIFWESVLRLTDTVDSKQEAESRKVYSGKSWNYRLRMKFHVQNGKIGFYRWKSKKIVEVENCPVFDKRGNYLLEAIRNTLKKAENEKFLANLKEIEIRVSDIKNEASILLVSKNRKGSKLFTENLLENLKDKETSISLYLSLPAKNNNRDDFEILYGEERIYDLLGRYNISYSPLSFTQPNINLAEKAYKDIQRTAENMNSKRILDVHSGIGITSLYLSEVGEVFGIEENLHSLEDARINAFLNEKRIEFGQLSAKDIQGLKEVDTVVLNPPRTGIQKEFLKVLVEAETVKNIIYLSCDPTTLSRDLDYLQKDSFKLKRSDIYDFYPQTYHIESLNIIQR